MTKQLKWRLGKLPTPDEVLKLVNDKLITKEEARDILFNELDTIEETVDSNNLKAEIKFLREIIDKLSTRTQIVKVIKSVQPLYYQYQWTTPYVTYCNALSTNTSGTMNLANAGTNATYTCVNDIQTF